MNSSSMNWTSRVEKYIAYRRALGYALTADGVQLMNFARFADRLGDSNVLTVDLAVRWATSVEQRSSITWSRRLNILRGLAKYCQQFDSGTEMPPHGLFGRATRRLTPHVFTEEELVLLLDTSKGLRPRHGMRPATCAAVFGLLASTGLRVSEALNLTRDDVDLSSGVLHIREAKYHKQRLVPLYPTAMEELKYYAAFRDQKICQAQSQHFFVMDNGKAANLDGMNQALRTVCKRLGWYPRSDYTRCRLRDFRHSFIVRNLLQFAKRGIKPDNFALALSTYVGHSDLTATYWYMSAVPELLALASQSFDEGGAR